MTERQVQLINDFRPDIITVTPSYMLAILDEFKRRELDPRKSSLKIGIFGAEPWTNAMRGEIEQSFDMDATDIYGLSEVMGPGVAQECIETKDGLHIWEDHFYPEVIDPETGEVLPDGEKGELVFTSLTKEAFPVDPLPHPRPDAAAAGHRAAGHAADGKGYRALRRHDHPARRQRVPDPDRGSAAGHRLVRRPFRHRTDAGGPHGRDDGAGGSPARKLGRQRAGRPRRAGRPSHQEHHRHHRPHPGGGPRKRWSARSARPGACSTSGRRSRSSFLGWCKARTRTCPGIHLDAKIAHHRFALRAPRNDSLLKRGRSRPRPFPTSAAPGRSG